MDNKNVYHPSHYNAEGRKECWEEMCEISPGGTALFDLWNSYKYLYRAGEKEGNSKEQDLEKARNYRKHACGILNSVVIPEEIEIECDKMLLLLNGMGL